MPLFVAVAVLCLAAGRVHAASDVYTQTVKGSISLINVLVDGTRTSTPLALVINSPSIPDNAVVVKVSIVTGTITRGPALGLNHIGTYNLRGPTMRQAAPKDWAGKAVPTEWTGIELGEAIPVKGTWLLSMTGTNIGSVAATTNHAISKMIIEYEY